MFYSRKRLNFSLMEKKGFTLLEVMIVVAIIGIMVGVAVPNFVAWMPRYRLRGAARQLGTDLQLAKIAAIRNKADCIFAFTLAAACPDGRGSYVAFIDDDGDNTQDAGEDTVTSVTMPVSVQLVGVSGPSTLVGFNSRGLAVGGGISRIDLSNSEGEGRRVTLMPAGNIQITP